MKALSIYKTEQKNIPLELGTILEDNLHSPLTDLQSYKIGLVEVFEGSLFTQDVDGYTIFKVRESKRKDIKDETIEREFLSRQKRAKEGIPLDLDILLEEVTSDLIRMSEIKDTTFLMFVDHKNNQVLVEAPRPLAEEGMQLLHSLLAEPVQFEVVQEDAAIMQKLLTSYVVKESNIPEPFALADHTELGEKSTVGEKAKASNVIVKKLPTDCDEVSTAIDNGKRVNKLELDFDAVIYFKIDNTFMINGIAFDQDLKYTDDPELTQSVNFISEYTLKLPEVSKMLGVLYKQVDSVEL